MALNEVIREDENSNDLKKWTIKPYFLQEGPTQSQSCLVCVLVGQFPFYRKAGAGKSDVHVFEKRHYDLLKVTKLICVELLEITEFCKIPRRKRCQVFHELGFQLLN